jgi:tRNA pseudouridine32 synthase/23S rRNA pseudouridine746 synthase
VVIPIDTFVAPVCHADIEMLYQDEFILLINKPSGLLSLSGKNPLNLDSVHYRLVKEYPTATMVHRLDFGTSGLMLLALNRAVNADLTKQFQARTVHKTYYAILEGHLEQDQGCIALPIAKDPSIFPRLKVCHESGKQATTDYRVVERLHKPPRTRVLFIPKTGRTHQLRIHSREIGHPILGCDLYGSDQSLSMADRLLLHAFSLDFDHPVSGERVKATCECPF